jgi:Na+-driven multidrug efflux pump
VKILRTPFLRFGKGDLALHRQTLGNLIKIGTPSAAKNTIIAIGGMTIMTVVNTFGTAFIAGFTSTNKLYGLLEICALSYGFAVTTYVGQNYGAGRFDRIRSGMKSAAVLAVATAVIIATLMFVFGRSITMLFISTDNVADAAQAGNVAYRYLCIMSSWLPVLYILYLLFSALQGLGDTVRPMLSGLVELACRVSVAVAVAIIGRESGIFLAEIFAWTGAAIYLGYHFRKRMKKGI